MISNTRCIDVYCVAQYWNHMTTLSSVIHKTMGGYAFVTLLSMLGLNASPLKSVTRSTCPAYRRVSRYSLSTETNRAAPPTGSCELQVRKGLQRYSTWV